MQWPARGADGSEEGKKELSLCFSEGGFSAFETNHTSINSWYVDPALRRDTKVIN